VTNARTTILTTAIAAVAVCLCIYLWHARQRTIMLPPPGTPSVPTIAANSLSDSDRTPTVVYAHNLILRKGANFRVYIRWLRGQMLRTNQQVNPSLDDPESFLFEIQKGVIHANIGDVANYLNAASPSDAPLKNISLTPEGDQLKLHGTVHKIFSLPVEVLGSLSPTPGGSIQFHVNKISVLKIPMKGLLGGFHLSLSDLIHSTRIPGMQVSENDVLFDTQRLLPPPHIHGQITSVRVHAPDLEIIYGNTPNDDAKLAQWHNFLRLIGGTVTFGKLTMHHTDLTMIDVTQAPWFDLDLVNYQAQLVHGYSRMTPQAGLEIFMPDLDDPSFKKDDGKVSLDWLKNRKSSVPSTIPIK